MNRRLTTIIALAMAVLMSVAMFAGCTKTPVTDNGTATDQPDTKKETPLVIAYPEFSEKFSPFFADTAYDMDAVSVTQLPMITTDRMGGIIFNAIEGETVNFNGTDYLYTGPCDIKVVYDKEKDETTYTVKMRDDIKFSDGTPATADDMIFTYYVYADPSYVGSTTLGSYDIIGLKNYQYNNTATEGTKVTAEDIAAALAKPSEALKAKIDAFVAATLTSEWDWAIGAAAGAGYDEATKHKYYTDTYNTVEGFDWEAVGTEKEPIVAAMIEQYAGDYKKLAKMYSGDENYFQSDIEGMTEELVLIDKLAASTGEPINYITGINKLDEYTVEVKTYGYSAPAVYTICGLQIVPMHYYGDAAQYDYEAHKFGFPFGDLSMIQDKTAQPMGAGPYNFIKFENKVIYYEANESYFKGTPVTKYLQFKTTTSAEVPPALVSGTADGGEMTYNKENFDAICASNSSGEYTGDVVSTYMVDNLGYGYIGINASTVCVGGDPNSDASKNLRKAIATMLSVYREVSVDSYYGEAAAIINYPISNTSWAAPQPTDPDYKVAFSLDVNGKDIYATGMTPDQKYAAALDAAKGYLIAAGYKFDEASGKFTAAPAGAKLSYEAIIPADGTGDHPTFGVLTDAAAALATIGMELKINDPADSNELWNAIDAGAQELWVAAWGATIDPDMYQTYHSSGIVGRGGSDSNHYHLDDPEVDQLILDARKSDDQTYRKSVYKQILDIIADYAVEIPVYQRQNCTVFSTPRIDQTTITPDMTTFWLWIIDPIGITMEANK
ncbi:MAG: ABC transporter substrate-binding protein [Clostridia bacterium]